jgi:hypothetical protein
MGKRDARGIGLCAKEPEQDSGGKHKAESKDELDHCIDKEKSSHFHKGSLRLNC